MHFRGHVDLLTRSEVVGWARDDDRPEASINVQVIVDGDIHGTTPADILRAELVNHLPAPSTGRYQFSYRFDPPLSPHRAYMVEVCPVGATHPLGNGRRRLSIPIHHTLPYRPVIISSTGRTGTTSLMRDFDQQPGIVTARLYPYEHKVASYYAVALRLMNLPRAFTGEDWVQFENIAALESRLTASPFNVPEMNRNLGGEHLMRFFGTTLPDRMGSMFRETVMEFYGIVATSQGKSDARFFAEKCVLNSQVRDDLRILLGDVREIVMVRDPRDYLCSAKAFWKQDAATALEIMRSDLPVLEKLHEARAPDTMIVRYEDYVQQPAETHRAMYSFIGLDANEVAEGPSTEDMIAGHATSSSAAASIGRWRRDLPEEEARACAAQFRSYMDRFGYAPG